MAAEQVNVSIAEDYLDRFPEVIARGKQAGLKVEQELELLGMVSGSIDSAKLEKLSKVPGVATVERAHEFQLPPPDSEVQ